MLNNCEMESAIASVLETLYCEVVLLSFLSVRIGASGCVDTSGLKYAVCNVLFSVLLMLYYRNISYRSVVGFVRERTLKLRSLKLALESKVSSLALV